VTTKSPVVLILLDAFRHDYISDRNTPFLYSCSKKGLYIEKIVPGNGFCERSEIFTGKSSYELGFFSAISFSLTKSTYLKIDIILRALNRLTSYVKFNFLNKVLRRLLWIWASKQNHPMPTYSIPYTSLKYFILTEDYNNMVSRGALHFPTIFDLLRDKEKTFFNDSFTSLFTSQIGNDNTRLDLVLKNIDAADFYLVYLANTDAIGHKFGPDSDEMRNVLQNLDFSLRDFVNQFQGKHPDAKFLFLGDHGMIPVEVKIDVKSLVDDVLNGAGLDHGKDYVYFFDSTIFRIWFIDQNRKEYVISKVSRNHELLENGIFIDQENSEKYKIPFGSEFGDIVWWANPGVLISPDFFHKGESPVKGMHGYLNSDERSKGMAIAFGGSIEKEIKKEKHLTYINFLLRELLDV